MRPHRGSPGPPLAPDDASTPITAILTFPRGMNESEPGAGFGDYMVNVTGVESEWRTDL